MDTAKGRLKTGVVKPVTVRLRDSITFTLSVTSMLLTAYFMGAYPGWMVPWYSVWLFGLLCLRFVVYYMSAWQLFMIDYCYLHNATLVLVLLFYPHSPELFQMLFTGSNGMLLWTISLYRRESCPLPVEKGPQSREACAHDAI